MKPYLYVYRNPKPGTVRKIQRITALVESGYSVRMACKEVGISDASYSKYKRAMNPVEAEAK